MQAIRSTNTKLEQKIVKALWNRGLRFRRNVIDLFGKPDIAIKKYKIVVFIDSCFWHGCDLHCRMPETNRDYWEKKIQRNKKRDHEVTQYYQIKGWKLLRIWEHEIKENSSQVVDNITHLILTAKISSK